MNRREQWRSVLHAEAKLWNAKTYSQLVSELKEEQVYEVQHEGNPYQVEVEILENTNAYLHYVISVDDGSIPASFQPMSESFICEKPGKSKLTTP